MALAHDDEIRQALRSTADRWVVERSSSSRRLRRLSYARQRTSVVVSAVGVVKHLSNTTAQSRLTRQLSEKTQVAIIETAEETAEEIAVSDLQESTQIPEEGSQAYQQLYFPNLHPDLYLIF